MKKLDYFIKNPYGQFLLFGIVLALIPLLQSVGLLKTSTMTILGNVLIYGVVALGFNLLLGYSGLVSLGTAGFMGIGAYTVGYFMTVIGAPFIVGLLVAMVISTIIGIIIGSISLRVEGIYLAILTLCISEILRRGFEEFIPITGGYSGLKIRSFELFGMAVSKGVVFLMMSVVMVGILVLYYNLTRGRVGRALLTMQGSESAAKAMGINIFFYKMFAFALASGFATLGGALYMSFVKFSYPTTWILTLSLQLLAVIVIGGFRSISGTIIGSFIIFGVPELILKKLPVIGDIDGLAYIFTGILIITVILFYPGGIAKAIGELRGLRGAKNE